MELTKYEHACFTVKKDGQILVIDPGEFTTDFIAPEHVLGVIVTHEHQDHFDKERLADIIDKNPEALIIGPKAVVSKIESFNTQVTSVGEVIKIGPFSVEFFGEQHAIIHPSFPLFENVGLLINDLLYYPGDSFVLPHKPVDTLALPAAAPWLKISESMDFLTEIKPRLAFPTHDAILSVEGKELTDRMLGNTAKGIGVTYQRLNETIAI